MIDIVTVVYRDELDFLKIQARSLDLYVKPQDLNTVYVIVNDTDDVCDLVDPGWWGQHTNIKIVPYSKWNYTSRINGWENQQLCKLLSASEAVSEWSISLDAKTWIVQPLDLTKLFDEQGRVTAGTIPVFKVFTSSREFLEQHFTVSMPDIIGPQGVPFVFHTATAKQMVTDIPDFIEFFQTNVRWPHLITEFHLYSAYVLSQHGTYEKLYNKTQYYRCCNIADFDVPNFDRHFKRMSTDNQLLTASIHRRAYPLLSSDQLNAWNAFLDSRKLNTTAIQGDDNGFRF
jgi:hypothetical protein